MQQPNIHPGEILREEFLKPAGLTAAALAHAIKVSVDRVEGILNGRLGVCVETALRLSHFFGTSERFWLEAQLRYDLERARHWLGAVREEITPLRMAC